jgi:hypothetical protein
LSPDAELNAWTIAAPDKISTLKLWPPAVIACSHVATQCGMNAE